MNQLWGYLIIEELVRNGIDYFVISPGSRSTPLTVAVAQNSQANKIICLDERAAGFHAIGYARATGNPAVLICTSGTAAANYLPAVIEASIDDIPLIILSSDRPPELRQTGANQTINQVNLYGNYPTWQFDLPCPTAEISPNVVLTTIDLAISRARQAPGGVVHLNCMFREPLAPTDAHVEIPASLVKWHEDRAPYTRYAAKLTIPAIAEIQSLIETIASTERGILFVGQLKSTAEIKAVIKLAARLNWAIFADIQSGLRLCQDFPNLIHYFDRLLLTDIAVELEQIDTIVQIGTKIVSAQWFKWIEKHPPTNYIAIANNPDRYDPNHLVSFRIESDITYLCDRLSQHLPQLSPSTWVQKLRSASDRIGVTAAKFLKTSKLTEPLIARTISELIPSQHGLWVSNSMPIRDLDMFGVGASAEDFPSISLRVGANRGTSGIEGAIASATGFAVGLQAPITAIVGDLSSLYDLNSLALLQHNLQPVIVVIINNDGGGIFSFLPIAKSTDLFEPYFGTPHGLKFDRVAAMFELDYYHPLNRDEFIHNYQQALAKNRSAIVEVTTDRSENLSLHQDLMRLCSSGNWQAIQQSID
ncbi:2-succinyl-5-enolpyruvyl-6-hydroxy-3-cyclohexene-1-carboxylic-acid synthase [Chamaesiphon minutus]|uniref:2-succinyl-5-enolpyruvyl-6-hydroxy-3-cyclohexene-1-carboxylate synthase n=1 Tax=Chamaesiphon minutus (strain ATCC 27169 / PCC 6605) TaxID=1173020 RepID=K9UIJ6_CHAP6|nr:2-succinyl-5-enolpyruvyl-6-hydroxy-3-cyclohexene-1-carboxylic-acid synthase [Chamaesiphon minutus]AFY94478.1 2-succinyl-5-enolpyruvyl-6-hydroxy-3-cyclohexene-1-carboxylic-acid synthase [Chamaesiphon minutus PCC 6605]